MICIRFACDLGAIGVRSACHLREICVRFACDLRAIWVQLACDEICVLFCVRFVCDLCVICVPFWCKIGQTRNIPDKDNNLKPYDWLLDKVHEFENGDINVTICVRFACHLREICVRFACDLCAICVQFAFHFGVIGLRCDLHAIWV